MALPLTDEHTRRAWQIVFMLYEKAYDDYPLGAADECPFCGAEGRAVGDEYETTVYVTHKDDCPFAMAKALMQDSQAHMVLSFG